MVYRFSMDHPPGEGTTDQSPSAGADSSTVTCGDDEQLQSLKSQIRLSEALSGIKFTNTSWEITHIGTVCLM